MKDIAAIFCLMFSFGVVFALIPIRRLDLLTSFFRTNALIGVGLYVLFGWLQPTQNYISYWPGVILLFYAAMVFWWPPLIAKVLLVSSLIGMGSQLNSIFTYFNSNSYNNFLEFTCTVVGAAIVGFSLVAMNIGHSYLSTVKLPMRPLRIATLFLMVLIVARLLLFVGGVFLLGFDELYQYFAQLGVGNFPILAIAMARVLFGLLGPALLVVMVWKTVEIESTQSATGILYAMLTMTIIGEGCALFLNLNTPIWF